MSSPAKRRRCVSPLLLGLGKEEIKGQGFPFHLGGSGSPVLPCLMERHVERLLNRISIASGAVATVLLLHLYLQTPPETCIPPDTPITKPHLKFPSSTCDPSLHRPHLPLPKKNHRLWSSNLWLSHLSSLTSFFLPLQSSGLFNNHSRILCASAGAGHEVMALNNMGVADVTGVELVDSMPLVKRADVNNLPFFDGAFDLAFTMRLGEALFPLRFAGEMERAVRKGGAVVVVVEECGGEEVREVVSLFRKSGFVGTENVTLVGQRMTSIVMRVGVAQS